MSRTGKKRRCILFVSAFASRQKEKPSHACIVYNAGPLSPRFDLQPRRPLPPDPPSPPPLFAYHPPPSSRGPKKIWSLCDPSLTGSIRRPGFFAAMRLIAIAQHQQGQGPPPSSPPVPSVSALEATRLAPLPLPRMEGCFPQPTGGDGGSGSGGSGGLSSVPAAAAGPATTGAPALHAAATSATLPALGNFPAMPIVGVGGGEAAAAAVGVEQASANSKDKEEDDFGDFTGAQEEAQPPPAPPTDDDDEGDDFGDFSEAPASVAAAAAAVTTAAPGAGGATATGGDSTSGDDIAWMMEDGDKNGGAFIGPDGMEAEKGGGGLDDLIKSNLQATTAGPVHLAAMVSAGRPYYSYISGVF